MAYLQTLKNTSNLGTWLTRRKQSQRRTIVASLMLTPMVDMFSLLVIFLLQFLSSSPEFMPVAEVQLPPSISAAEMAEAVTVSISLEDVFVSHEKVGPLADVLKDPAAFSDALLKAREKWATDHPGKEFTGDVNLEAHQEVPSTSVATIMTILNGHHFGSINLLALGGES